MKRIHLIHLTLLFIVPIFGAIGCTPSASAPTSPPSAIEACDVSAVRLSNIHWFQEPDGAWRVVGMLHNNSSQPISKVFMEVLTMNKNDKSVFPNGPQGEDFSAYPPRLLPGGQAPFSVWIKREIPGLDHFTIDKEFCVVAEPAERLQLQERGGQLLVDDDGVAHVTLEVVNPGTKPALLNDLMVAVFDASDRLISAVSAEVAPRLLNPGESGPIRATLALPPGSATQVKTYKLYMDAIATDSAAETLDVTKDIQVSTQYLDTAGHLHLVGQITNPNDKPLMVSVQAAIYTDSTRAAVADATSLDTLIPLAPGASMPFDLTDWQVLNNKAGLWEEISKQNAAIILRVEPFRTWTMDTSVATLTVVPQQPVFNTEGATFSGRVKNETGRNIILGTVTVTFRDKTSGKITATRQAALDIVNALADGDMLNYSIALPLGSDFDPQTMQFEIIASGQQT
jgi:hypothetical protein